MFKSANSLFMHSLDFSRKINLYKRRHINGNKLWSMMNTHASLRALLSIEICTVDIFTLAFSGDCSVLEKKNADSGVKTNWCAPNLHIDWELHQASLMNAHKKRLWRWDWWLWWSCHSESYVALQIKTHTHWNIINYNVSPSYSQERLLSAHVYKVDVLKLV